MVPLAAARWVQSDDPKAVDRFIEENKRRIFVDFAGNYTFIGQSAWAMNYAAEQYPDLQFVKTMEI